MQILENRILLLYMNACSHKGIKIFLIWSPLVIFFRRANNLVQRKMLAKQKVGN